MSTALTQSLRWDFIIFSSLTSTNLTLKPSDEALNLSSSEESNCVEGDASGEQSTQNSDDITVVIGDKIPILEPLATLSFQANSQIDFQEKENAYNEKKRASEDERISDPVTEIRKVCKLLESQDDKDIISKSEEPGQEKENIDFEIPELEAELVEVCATGPHDMKNVNITDTDSAGTTSNKVSLLIKIALKVSNMKTGFVLNILEIWFGLSKNL